MRNFNQVKIIKQNIIFLTMPSNPALNYEIVRSAWWRSYAPHIMDYKTIGEYFTGMTSKYFVTLYLNEGYDSLVLALTNWIIECDNGVIGNNLTFYGETNVPITREEFIEQITRAICLSVGEQPIQHEANFIEEALVDLSIPVNPIPDQKDLNDELMATALAQFDPLDLQYLDTYYLAEYNNMQAAELCRKDMVRTYENYIYMIEYQKKSQEEKRNMAEQLATEINRWAHFVFTRPFYDQDSVDTYMNQKYKKLIEILPGLHTNPYIKELIRRGDKWNFKMFEVEPTPSEGICNVESIFVSSSDESD